AHAVPIESKQLMISAASIHAVEAGKEIARRGGNVVDVAVTVALCLAVTNPQNASFGGGGFALVKLGKDVAVLDFRETAPLATSKNFYKNKSKDASLNGGNAVGIPGLPAGLWEMHKKY